MHYQNDQSGNVDVRDITQLQVKNGYWINSNINPAPSIHVTGTDAPVAATLTLQSGWNQIGNPFIFDVSWAAVLALNPSVTTVGALFTYNIPTGKPSNSTTDF